MWSSGSGLNNAQCYTPSQNPGFLQVPLSLLIGEGFFFNIRKLHLPGLGFSLLWVLHSSEGRSPTNLGIKWKHNNSPQNKVGFQMFTQVHNSHLSIQLFALGSQQWPLNDFDTIYLMTNGNLADFFFFNRLWYLQNCSVLNLLLPHLNWLRKQSENMTLCTNKSQVLCNALLYFLWLSSNIIYKTLTLLHLWI
jgi:hypothetical protein